MLQQGKETSLRSENVTESCLSLTWLDHLLNRTEVWCLLFFIQLSRFFYSRYQATVWRLSFIYGNFSVVLQNIFLGPQKNPFLSYSGNPSNFCCALWCSYFFF